MTAVLAGRSFYKYFYPFIPVEALSRLVASYFEDVTVECRAGVRQWYLTKACQACRLKEHDVLQCRVKVIVVDGLSSLKLSFPAFEIQPCPIWKIPQKHWDVECKIIEIKQCELGDKKSRLRNKCVACRRGQNYQLRLAFTHRKTRFPSDWYVNLTLCRDHGQLIHQSLD